MTLKSDLKFKIRFLWFLSQSLVIVAAAWGYSLFGTLFIYIPKDYQWILALISPLIREILVKLSLEVSYKSAGYGSRGICSIKQPCNHYMETRHAIAMSIIIGGVATPASTYCVIGMDFMINVYRGLKIIYRSKITHNISKTEGRNMLRYFCRFAYNLVFHSNCTDSCRN